MQTFRFSNGLVCDYDTRFQVEVHGCETDEYGDAISGIQLLWQGWNFPSAVSFYKLCCGCKKLTVNGKVILESS
jgi:hypothetical protein